MFWIYKKLGNTLLVYICGIWMVSSVFSFIFSIYFKPRNISFQPIMFFDLCFLLCLFSLTDFKYNNVRIRKCSVENFYRFMYILGVISILPLFENGVYVVQSYFNHSSDSVIDMYNTKMDVDTDAKSLITWLSFPGRIFNAIVNKFTQLSYILFFIILERKRLKLRQLIICLLPILNTLMYAMARSGRGAVSFTLLYMVFLFLLFKDFIEEELRNKLKVVFIAVFGFFICVVIMLTIIRYTNSMTDKTMLLSVSLYLGEGQLRFFDEMWNIHVNTAGDNSFSFFKYIFGGDTFVNNLDRREFWNINKTGVDPRYFYTFIGDIYSDLGKYSIILYGILFVIIRRCLKKTISVCTLYMLCVFCYILINGFTMYPFKIFSLTSNVFIGLLTLYVLTKKPINTNIVRK